MDMNRVVYGGRMQLYELKGLPMFFAFSFIKIGGRAVRPWILTLAFLCSAFSAQAENVLSQSFYRSYSGDINGDGEPDVLLKAFSRTVVISVDDDLSLPLQLRPKTSTFVLLSQGNGTYALIASPDSAIVSSSAWLADSHDLIYGDVLGNGVGSVLIKAKASGSPSFVVAKTSAGALQLIQHLTTSAIEIDLSATGTSAVLQDKNSDGRTDLVVKVNNNLSMVLVADSNGMFYRDDESTIRAIWLELLAALNGGDTQRAINYFIGSSRDRYKKAFAELGEDITKIAPNLSTIEFVELQPNYANLVVTQTIGTQTRMHFVSLIYDVDGWRITDM